MKLLNGGDSVCRHEVNCMRENEAMGIVVDPTPVEFLVSQPVRPSTVVLDGPILHQTIRVTECDEQSVVDEVDDVRHCECGFQKRDV